jgi:uncharacterized RDD family membrane protein YckC
VNQAGQLPRVNRGAYTSWGARVLALVIDVIPYVVITTAGLGIEVSTRETLCAATTTPYDIAPFCATGNSPVGVLVFLLSLAVGFAYLVWNYGYRQGKTGSTIGKTVLKFKVVGERTGQPIGFGRSVLRQLAHVVDAIICYVGFLFPLWDGKRQTIADKMTNTVCLPVSGTR